MFSKVKDKGERLWGVKYRREILHIGRWELFLSAKAALPQEQTDRNLDQKSGKKLLTVSEILKYLSNRTKHASEKCNECVEMTALYLGYLWEAITWHQTAEPAGLTSYGTDMPGWVKLQPSSPGMEHRLVQADGTLREKQQQEEGAQ